MLLKIRGRYCQSGVKKSFYDLIRWTKSIAGAIIKCAGAKPIRNIEN